MPRQFGGYAPDQVDCHTLSVSLAHEFGMVPEITTAYVGDYVTVVCRCRILGSTEPNDVIVQAIDKIECRHYKSLYILHYTVMLDCWHQLDRESAAVVAVPSSVDGTDARSNRGGARKQHYAKLLHGKPRG